VLPPGIGSLSLPHAPAAAVNELERSDENVPAAWKSPMIRGPHTVLNGLRVSGKRVQCRKKKKAREKG
jgi:hypothetical protein